MMTLECLFGTTRCLQAEQLKKKGRPFYYKSTQTWSIFYSILKIENTNFVLLLLIAENGYKITV